MKLTTIEARYWTPGIAEREDRRIVECAIANDGLLYMFTGFTIIDILIKHYPFDKDASAWFFNRSRDRHIAETQGERILVNPQFVTKHFLETAF